MMDQDFHPEPIYDPDGQVVKYDVPASPPRRVDRISSSDGEYYEGGERESPYRNQESQGKRNIGINHPRPSETFFPPNWTNRFSKQPIYYAVFPTSLRLVFFGVSIRNDSQN